MAHRHKRAHGGRMNQDHEEHEKEIEHEAEKKAGGRVVKRKDGGAVPGFKRGGRLDRRARGGRAGSDKHPFSSAHAGSGGHNPPVHRG